MTAISDAGFTRTRLDQRLAALQSAVQGIFGIVLDVTPESPEAQFLGVFAEAIADIDSLAEAVFNGRSPSGARGTGLSRLVRLNGVTRKPAQFSIAPITLGGDPGTVIPSGSLIAADDGSGAVFQTTASLTIGGGNTVTGQVRATVAGPVVVSSGHIVTVQTVISGWNTATNASASSGGAFEETDAELRIRRAASVAIPSQGIVDGLFAAVANLDGVLHTKVYENPSNATDANGLPPHSVNVIVDGGTNTDIANAIWLKKSLGVTLVGGTSLGVVDAQGQTQTMRWDLPIDRNIYVIVQLSAAVGSGTQDAIKNAIVAWGNSANDGVSKPNSNYTIGSTVIWSQLFVPINSVPGLSVTALFIGNAPSPTAQANLPVGFNAIARWFTGNIQVVGP